MNHLIYFKLPSKFSHHFNVKMFQNCIRTGVFKYITILKQNIRFILLFQMFLMKSDCHCDLMPTIIC